MKLKNTGKGLVCVKVTLDGRPVCINKDETVEIHEIELRPNWKVIIANFPTIELDIKAKVEKAKTPTAKKTPVEEVKVEAPVEEVKVEAPVEEVKVEEIVEASVENAPVKNTRKRRTTTPAE